MIDCKFKEKHYKKGRFSEKEKLIAEFKDKNITKELEETEIMCNLLIESNFQVLKKNHNIIFPKQNEVVSIRTQSQLNLFSLFLMFIEKYKKIDFLSIQTYTVNEKTIFALKKLLDEGKISKLQIIITETLNFRMPKIYLLIKEIFANNSNCNLCFYWIHSKVNLIQCENEKFILDGSGNFSMNAQVEHYNIFNSENMFNEELKWQNNFFFGDKLRKHHEIYKNY